jgi:epsilon-lactone hydrolase
MNNSSTWRPVFVPSIGSYALHHSGHSLWPAKPLTDSLRRRTVKLVLLLGAPFVLFGVNGHTRAQTRVYATVDADGTAHVPALAIPLSTYMSEEAKQLAKKTPFEPFDEVAVGKLSPDQQRKMADDSVRSSVARAQAAYPVNIKEQEIAGVPTDIIEPKQGASLRNRDRVLISLHGGGYAYASGGQARLLEAIPVSGYLKIKVVSVDYRMSPKHKWPAAVEDVVAVYRALLRQYRPESVGIYGCSTGASLTANVIARLQKDRLPRPGAIGLFCQGATKDNTREGDSSYFAPAMGALGGQIRAPNAPFFPFEPYMEGTDANDPLVAPVVSLDVLSKFPPTLLVSGTRDQQLSGVLYTHSRLVKAGVEARLHVWDGMGHGFYMDVDLPESKDAYDVMTKFFDRHLGLRKPRQCKRECS